MIKYTQLLRSELFAAFLNIDYDARIIYLRYEGRKGIALRTTRGTID
jgi:hypothetical protein